MAAVLASGGRVGVVRNADEMLVLLDAWGILRARDLALRARVADESLRTLLRDQPLLFLCSLLQLRAGAISFQRRSGRSQHFRIGMDTGHGGRIIHDLRL